MKEVVVTEEIPFETVEESDSTLLKGERSVVQTGVNGKKEVTYDIEYIDGVESSRTIRTTTVIQEPVDEIVRVGIQEPPPSTDPIETVEPTSPPTSPSAETTAETLPETTTEETSTEETSESTATEETTVD